jgi:hypothetical protein
MVNLTWCWRLCSESDGGKPIGLNTIAKFLGLFTSGELQSLRISGLILSSSFSQFENKINANTDKIVLLISEFCIILV